MTRTQSKMPSLVDAPQGAANGSPSAKAGKPGQRVNSDQMKMGVAIIAIVAAAGFFAWQFLNSGPDMQSILGRGAAVDEQGGQFANFTIPDSAPPWTNPKTGAKDLWPAEQCWWTKTGEVRSEPFLVKVLPETSVTCPDCGRRVTLRNPAPPYTQIEAARKRDAARK
jgi:hypothetical protein